MTHIYIERSFMPISRCLLAFLPALLVSPAFAGSPLEAALSTAADGPLYAYDVEYKIGDYVATARVDPSQPEGQRVNVLSPPESKWDDELRQAVAEMEADSDGDIWCDDVAENVPLDAQFVSETATTATYTFTPIPDTDAPEDVKFFKHLQGEITIDTINPGIIELKMWAPKPFRPVMIAKIKSFNLLVSCAPTPDGRRYVERIETHVTGSAALQKFQEHEIVAISNLSAVEN